MFIFKHEKIFLVLCITIFPTLGFTSDTDVLLESTINAGMWPAEDCIRLSKASGFYLKISGDLLKESGEKRDKGDNRRADELGSASLYFSNQAANYANNYKAYCKQ